MSDAQYYNTLPYAGGKKQGARESQNERPLTIDLVSSRYAHFCPSPVPMDMETAANTSMNSAQAVHFSPPSFRRMIPQSIALEMSSPTGPFRQYSVSPITVENDQYFSYPNMAAMGMTFMPCVCMPDFSVSENGKSKKACRRCSITPVKKRYIDHDSQMTPIDFEVTRSKVKVTLQYIGKQVLSRDDTGIYRGSDRALLVMTRVKPGRCRSSAGV
ncbi:hypothetical protein DPMN_140130 [Dreissena polymorpha]|uniref:Uncharacterized protein n=1 Tax=Dreissena polymorpha TaxID=45954 RepID=A0A9D4JH52_DREPO|nr:hypothetical protein DPMN_140130 [Dreissena polymorpha]